MPRCRIAASTSFWVSLMLAPLAAGAQAGAGDGFMFGAPTGNLTIRAGFAQPLEGSDLYSFVRKELTLGRGDLAGASVSSELAFFLSQRVAVQVGIGYSGRLASSVYRNWVDNNDKEIVQSTELRRMPLSLGIRYYLSNPGRSLGRLAWVPAKFAPYASAGLGVTWYSFRQTGDFVDYQTLDVFPSTLTSDAWTTSAFGALGVEYALRPRTGLVAEVRYDRAKAGLSNDFLGFDRIDLSGVAATVGLMLRF